jgi:outer membrane lipoprotein-sorting protein
MLDGMSFLDSAVSDPAAADPAVVDAASSEPAASERAGKPARRRLLRWTVPAAGLVAVALVAGGMLSAGANPNLPSRTAAEVLARIDAAGTANFSGTVVEKAALGLPQLGAGSGLLGSADSSALGLLSGSHTIRVWYAGEGKQRVALMDSLGETDLFRNGNSLWEWDSEKRTAVHHTLPAQLSPGASASLQVTSPDQAAQRILKLVSPTTTVTTDRDAVVAGRPAYVLVVSPKDPGSRIGQVRISVDGKTSVPLAVQVYARDSERAALDVSFTRFDTAVPSADNFTWQPPADVKVTQAPPAEKQPTLFGKGTTVSRVGSSWTTVLKVTGLPTKAALAKANPQAALLLGLLPASSGSWGSGRVFESGLLTALITDDGRAFVGSVDPSVLFAAAARR